MCHSGKLASAKFLSIDFLLPALSLACLVYFVHVLCMVELHSLALVIGWIDIDIRIILLHCGVAIQVDH